MVKEFLRTDIELREDRGQEISDQEYAESTKADQKARQAIGQNDEELGGSQKVSPK